MQTSSHDTQNQKYSHGSLSLRLTVWFLLLSFLPLAVMLVFIRGNISERLRDLQTEAQRSRVKEVSITISRYADSSNIDAILQSSMTQTGVLFLINYDGEIVKHPLTGSIGKNIQDIYPSKVLQEIHDKADGYIIDPGNNLLITFTPVPGTTNYLVAVNNDPALFAAVTEIEIDSLLQLGISLVIVSLIAGIIIWFIVGKPVQALTQASRAVASGNLDVKVDPQEMSDELSVLGSTFNHMADRLQQTIDGLEENLKELEEAKQVISMSENRYRSIFETVPVSIWEEDLTELYDLVDSLRDSGVKNIRGYLLDHPDFIEQALASVKILNINQQTLELFEANTKTELMRSLEIFATDENRSVFMEELNAVFRDELEFESEVTYGTLSGRHIQTIIRITLPGRENPQKIALVSILNITEQKQNAMRIQRQIDHLSALRQIDMAIASHLDLRSTLNILLTQIRRQLNVDAVNILQFNRHMNSLTYIASTGFHTNALQNTHLRLGEGFAGRAALERVPLFIADLSKQTTPFDQAPKFPDENFVSYYGIALIAKGEIKGVLEIFNRSPIQFTPDWEEFVKDLATQGAMAIDSSILWEEQRRINEELRLAYDSTLKGWSYALELRDMETSGHSERVIDLTIKLARKMGIHEDELIHIRRGAILHDIGKMGISEKILKKPGKLDEKEWEEMRKHPVFARSLLEPIAFLRPAMAIPYSHHEWWNGSGYPQGLKGEEIPLAARIFALVDVWDALSHDRPYNKAWSHEAIMEYIQKQSGIQFDPGVVRVFLELLNEEHIT